MDHQKIPKFFYLEGAYGEKTVCDYLCLKNPEKFRYRQGENPHENFEKNASGTRKGAKCLKALGKKGE